MQSAPVGNLGLNIPSKQHSMYHGPKEAAPPPDLVPTLPTHCSHLEGEVWQKVMNTGTKEFTNPGKDTASEDACGNSHPSSILGTCPRRAAMWFTPPAPCSGAHSPSPFCPATLRPAVSSQWLSPQSGNVFTSH